MTEYRSAKRRLHNAVNRSNARCLQDLVDEVNGDLWGLGYKLVTREIGAVRKPCSFKAEKIDRIVRALFPVHLVYHEDVGAESGEVRPLFSIKGLELAVLFMKKKKVPGPDGIPTKV